ncbi:MAG: hypothetical protein IJY42_01270 [Clostridia bacterium]|nr:hypothetical protein [Clostridia bacterium]
MPLIDLHTHTTYSDGKTTVENSLRCAENLGLSILSITDHNTVKMVHECGGLTFWAYPLVHAPHCELLGRACRERSGWF